MGYWASGSIFHLSQLHTYLRTAAMFYWNHLGWSIEFDIWSLCPPVARHGVNVVDRKV